MHHGLYSQAIQKSVRYFVTEFNITGDDIDYATRRKYKDSIQDAFPILEHAARVGDEYLSFGNSFTSFYRPFTRELLCPKCGFKATLAYMEQDKVYRFENGKFMGHCPAGNCKFHGAFERIDTAADPEKHPPKVIRWPPQHMEIKHNPISQRSEYKLDVARFSYLRDGVMSGDLLFLEDTPWEIIEAITKNEKFTFDDDEIFHLSNSSLSCCIPSLRGWGLPPFMSEFETVILIHMLDKYTEAILVDYLVPFRIITPPGARSPGTNEGDPMLQLNMGDFMGNVRTMLEQHRRNPTGWNTLPVPVEYQVLGGEASQLAPIEIQEHFEQRLLNSMGIPSDFYKSGSGLNSGNASALIGLKMFERTWQHFVGEINRWLTWVVGKYGQMMNWENVDAKLTPISLHEDPEIRQIKLQLAAGNEISRDTAYKPLGIDLRTERSKIMDEEAAFQEEIEKKQKEDEKRMANADVARALNPGEKILSEEQAAAEAQAAQQGGGMAPPPGAAPPPIDVGGVGAGATMDDIMMQADEIAQQLLGSDSTQRRRTLSDVKSSNEALYAQVKSRLQDLENEAKQTGVQMARAGQLPPPQ
jgi:hypothetical protein